MEFNWHPNKNSKLKEFRKVSFEQVAKNILSGNYRIQPNHSKNHAGQEVFVVQIGGVVWLVPFTKNKRTQEVFLHTIMRRDGK